MTKITRCRREVPIGVAEILVGVDDIFEILKGLCKGETDLFSEGSLILFGEPVLFGYPTFGGRFQLTESVGGFKA